MITIDDLFDEKNVDEALKHLMKKSDSVGSDGMRIGDLESYWLINREHVESEIRQGLYYPDVVKNYEITNAHGKRRTVSSQSARDRLLSRMLSQILRRELDGLFSER